MSRLLVTICIVLILSLAVVIPAWADVTLSGSQTRGQGSNGTLKCIGMNLPLGGTIVSASDAGAGFWLQGPGGRVLRFNSASRAVGTALSPGTWYAYPNLPTRVNNAGCSLRIKCPQKTGSTKGDNARSAGSKGGR